MNFACHCDDLMPIINTSWECVEAYNIGNLERRYGDNLIETVSAPTEIFTNAQLLSARHRALWMHQKICDIVVVLVIQINDKHTRTEYLPYSRLDTRVAEIKTIEEDTGLNSDIKIAYSEESNQIFYFDGVRLDVEARLPEFDRSLRKKRVGYKDKEE